ncbi:MAG: hypothetical protein ACXADC_05125 [Candidatus Thorarchaeota archaeon]
MAKETEDTEVKSQHPNSQSSDREDVDEKDVSEKKNEKRVPIEDLSELETFWRSYIA